MVTLADYLLEDHICWIEGMDKEHALRILLAALARSKAVKDPAALERAILDREVLMTTGIGYGVAIPHACLPAVGDYVLALGISPDGIRYGAMMDDAPVRLVVMIVGPEHSHAGYLRLLSCLMRFIKSEKGKILSCTSATEIRGFAEPYYLDAQGAGGPAGNSIRLRRGE